MSASGKDLVFSAEEQEKIKIFKEQIKEARDKKNVNYYYCEELEKPECLKLLCSGLVTVEDFVKYLKNSWDHNSIQSIDIQGKIRALSQSKNTEEALKSGWVSMAWIFGRPHKDQLLIWAMLSDNGMIVRQEQLFDKLEPLIWYHWDVFYSDGAIAAFKQQLVTVQQVLDIVKDTAFIKASVSRRHYADLILQSYFSPIGLTMLDKGYIRLDNMTSKTEVFFKSFAAFVSPQGLKACEDRRIVNPKPDEMAEMKREPGQLTLSQLLSYPANKVAIFISPNYQTALEKKYIAEDDLTNKNAKVMEAVLKDSVIEAAQNGYIDIPKILQDFSVDITSVLLSENGLRALSGNPPLLTLSQAALFNNKDVSVLSEFLKPENQEAVKRGDITPEQASLFQYGFLLAVILKPDNLAVIKRGDITFEQAATIEHIAIMRTMLGENGLAARRENLITIEQANKFSSNAIMLNEVVSPSGRVALKSGIVSLAEFENLHLDEFVQAIRLLFSPQGLIAKNEGVVSIKDFKIYISEYKENTQDDPRLKPLLEKISGVAIQRHLEARQKQDSAAEYKAPGVLPLSLFESRAEIAKAAKEETSILAQAEKEVSDILRNAKPEFFIEKRRKISKLFDSLECLNRFREKYIPSLVLAPHQLIERKLEILNAGAVAVNYTTKPLLKKNETLKALQMLYYQLIMDYRKLPNVNQMGNENYQRILDTDHEIVKNELKDSLSLKMVKEIKSEEVEEKNSIQAIMEIIGSVTKDTPYNSQKNVTKHVPTALQKMDEVNEFNKNFFRSWVMKPHEVIAKKLYILNIALISSLNENPGAFSDREKALQEFQSIYFNLITEYLKDPSLDKESVENLRNAVNNHAVLKLDKKHAVLKPDKKSIAKEQKESKQEMHKLFDQDSTPLLAKAINLIDKKLEGLKKLKC